MNILYLNTTYLCGGAEKVANQIFDGMRERGHHVYEIVSYHKKSEQLKEGIHVLYPSMPMLLFNRLITRNHSNTSLCIPYSRLKIIRFIKKHNIDLIHIHNAHGNFLGIHDIQKLSEICPVIWTVHDFWPLTGHCTYPTGCPDLWRSGCLHCPQLANYPPIRKDIARKLLAEKHSSFQQKNIHYVVPSHWMLKQFRQSHLVAEHCSMIYNSLNPAEWKTYDKTELRKKYHIPQNMKVLAFVAADPDKPLKGMSILLNALQQISSPESYLLLIAGQSESFSKNCKKEFQIRSFGYLTDQKKMNEFYSLADLLINPSTYETFGLVTIESMASGTPVAAFSICAMPEILTDDCGWCIPVPDSSLLAHTIETAFSNTTQRKVMEKAARSRIETIFSEKQMLDSYETLYHQVLNH